MNSDNDSDYVPSDSDEYTSDSDKSENQIHVSDDSKIPSETENIRYVNIIIPRISDIIPEVQNTEVQNNEEEINKGGKRKYEWGDNMSKREYNRKKRKYDNILKEITKPVITVPEILDSNLSFNEKCDMVEKKHALDCIYPRGFDYITIRNNFKNEFKNLKRKNSIDDKKKDIKKIRVKINKDLEIDKDNKCCLEEKILLSNMKYENKKRIYEKYMQLSLAQTTSDDEKILKWIKLCMRLPTKINNNNIFSNLRKDIKSNKSNLNEKKIFDILHDIRNKLDNKIFAMNDAKDRIIEILYSRFTNPNIQGTVLALVGSPGIGKTLLIENLSKILNIPMEKISMGGINDPEFITGTRPLYIGAEPGTISKALINMKCTNGLLYMDEFDKIVDSKYSDKNLVCNSLLSLLDFTQNDKWEGDQYFSPISIDLSNIWFVLSMNDEFSIPEVLRDRIEVINIEGYSTNQKISITKNFLLPDIFDDLRIKESNFKFENNYISYIINSISSSINKNNKGGVRYIKHFFKKLICKLNLLRLYVLFLMNSKITCYDSSKKQNELFEYLSDDQIKIIKKIMKDTYDYNIKNDNIVKKNTIFVSNNILNIIRDNIITTVDDAPSYMYI